MQLPVKCITFTHNCKSTRNMHIPKSYSLTTSIFSYCESLTIFKVCFLYLQKLFRKKCIMPKYWEFFLHIREISNVWFLTYCNHTALGLQMKWLPLFFALDLHVPALSCWNGVSKNSKKWLSFLFPDIYF